MSFYVDVHTHLTHEKFSEDRAEVIKRAEHAGVDAMIVNGLEPISNRQILAMAQSHKSILPALGIYPIDAINRILPEDFTLDVNKFDVDQEIKFIDEQAAAKNLVAIGECGLDGYWVGEETYMEQERVFEALIEIALKYSLPLIIHTRKLERRAGEILAHHKAEKVIFHCFGGKTNMALKYAKENGWWFSIPANARKNQAFGKMLRLLPAEKLLTETDAPYLSPERGQRNEPANVVGTIEYFAEIRSWSIEEAKQQVWQNFNQLFKI